MWDYYYLVIYLVVAVRLLLPLLIPRWPLFGILACVVFDSADQSIMQAFGFNPPWYQGYDKALDVYYLSVAYLATMRNWENVGAFQISRVLYYLRLMGVLAFELSGARWLLFAFPNAFEPFFVYYEIVRRRGNPLLLTRNVIVVVVAVIWFLFKLPHEWWVHIARLDGTDFIKTKILGALPDTPLWRAIVEAPAVTGALTFVAALLVFALWRFRKRRKQWEAADAGQAPKRWPAHWRRPAGVAGRVGAADPRQWARRRLRIAMLRGHTALSVRPWVLVEKIVLVITVSVIFQQILPGLEANGVQTALFIALAIMATDFLLRWVLRRFGVPSSPGTDLFVTALLNFTFVLVFQLIVPLIPPEYNLKSALVFAALITLFVTLYDHYRPIYDARELDLKGREGETTPLLLGPAPSQAGLNGPGGAA
ncbi:MAG: hypothetical protein LLG45_12855 [Actinomycetia bacterium]|nr:hypothetical protein [Actinomycetes bacterium]